MYLLPTAFVYGLFFIADCRLLLQTADRAACIIGIEYVIFMLLIII
jgi:hypothetical protein